MYIFWHPPYINGLKYFAAISKGMHKSLMAWENIDNIILKRKKSELWIGLATILKWEQGRE